MRTSALLALLLFEAVLVCAATGPAHAQAPPRVRLDYDRQEGAAPCPDASAIQVGVAARLGYDPFEGSAAEVLHVTVRQTQHGLEARIELADAEGRVRAERRLLSRQGDCKELAASVELAIAIAIDPSGTSVNSAGAGEPRVEPVSPPTATAAEVAPPAAAPTEAPAAPAVVEGSAVPTPGVAIAGETGADLVMATGAAPSPSFGLLVRAGLRRAFLSLGLEARGDLPSSRSLSDGAASASVSAALVTVSLVPCLRSTYLGFCGVASAGLFHASSAGLVDPHSVNLFYSAAGARVALTYPLATHWALELHGDATHPFARTTLTAYRTGSQSADEVWRSSMIAVALGLGVTANIP